jgi:outer membrane immunogenic protein
MRRLLIRISSTVGAAVLVMMTAQFASAADLPTTAAPYAPPIVRDWNGVYVGVSLGGRWSDTSWSTTAIGTPSGPPDPTTTPASFNSSSFRAGGYLGYNWQLATLLVGFEADAAWGHNSKTLAGIPGTFGPSGLGVDASAQAFDSSNVKLGWDGSLRGRVGYLITPTWLVYATGGMAWQQVDINATCNGSFFNSSWCIAPRNETTSTTRIGWTVGGGIETMLWNNWLLRAEYRYADYGSINHTFFAGTGFDEVAMSQSLKTNTGLIGLGYKF